MDSATNNTVWPSSKDTAKRCLSPSKDIMLGDINNKKKRKVANPLLILVQAKVFGKTSDVKAACLDDLEEQYEAAVKQTNKPQEQVIQDQSSTNNQEQIDLIQSTDSLSLEYFHPSYNSSSDCLSYSSKRNNSLNSSSSHSSFSTSSISSISSSYTSCTQPLAGHQLSDSCVPHSSVLDTEPDDAPDLQHSGGRRRSKRSRRSFKRDSFDDTSKDISDIEDWDIDESGETSKESCNTFNI